jgi:hypothetical protein
MRGDGAGPSSACLASNDVTAFSKRHRRALADARLTVNLVSDVPQRVSKLLERHNQTYTAVTESNWTYDTDTLDDLATDLLDVYGLDELPHPEGNGRNIVQFVRGAPHQCVFDAVELFLPHVGDDERPRFIGALNALLKEEGEPWRMLEGEMVPLDAEFARDELADRADGVIRAVGFDGAAAELRRARNLVADGDERGAVHRAGAAFESVMMAMLKREDGKAAKLLQDLLSEKYFKDLPVQMRQPFVRQVLGAMVWMRNNLGGHGQGEQTVEVPRAYAELATDLAATFSHFLISLQIEREGIAPNEARQVAGSQVVAPVDVPSDLSDFVPANGSSDDDIPF